MRGACTVSPEFACYLFRTVKDAMNQVIADVEFKQVFFLRLHFEQESSKKGRSTRLVTIRLLSRTNISR